MYEFENITKDDLNYYFSRLVKKANNSYFSDKGSLNKMPSLSGNTSQPSITMSGDTPNMSNLSNNNNFLSDNGTIKGVYVTSKPTSSLYMGTPEGKKFDINNVSNFTSATDKPSTGISLQRTSTGLPNSYNGTQFTTPVNVRSKSDIRNGIKNMSDDLTYDATKGYDFSDFYNKEDYKKALETEEARLNSIWNNCNPDERAKFRSQYNTRMSQLKNLRNSIFMNSGLSYNYHQTFDSKGNPMNNAGYSKSDYMPNGEYGDLLSGEKERLNNIWNHLSETDKVTYQNNYLLRMHQLESAINQNNYAMANAPVQGPALPNGSMTGPAPFDVGSMLSGIRIGPQYKADSSVIPNYNKRNEFNSFMSIFDKRFRGLDNNYDNGVLSFTPDNGFSWVNRGQSTDRQKVKSVDRAMEKLNKLVAMSSQVNPSDLPKFESQVSNAQNSLNSLLNGLNLDEEQLANIRGNDVQNIAQNTENPVNNSQSEPQSSEPTTMSNLRGNVLPSEEYEKKRQYFMSTFSRRYPNWTPEYLEKQVNNEMERRHFTTEEMLQEKNSQPILQQPTQQSVKNQPVQQLEPDDNTGLQYTVTSTPKGYTINSSGNIAPGMVNPYIMEPDKRKHIMSNNNYSGVGVKWDPNTNSYSFTGNGNTSYHYQRAVAIEMQNLKSKLQQMYKTNPEQYKRAIPFFQSRMNALSRMADPTVNQQALAKMRNLMQNGNSIVKTY